MSKKEKKTQKPQDAAPQQAEETAAQAQPEEEAQPEAKEDTAADEAAQALAQEQDKFLRLAAEYDNYRKRTAKEKEAAWGDATADAVAAFLPVYDNLERALKQDTADEAYKKGVEMIMNQFRETLAKLDVTEIEAQDQPFDPNVHNAVMHIEDENLGENTVSAVFQAGFKRGDKVIRFAMVQVAN